MTTYYLSTEMHFFGKPDATDDDFDEFTDRVMDELDKLDCVDPDMTCSLRDRKMAIMMGVRADGQGEAVVRFLSAVRTALHAAECHTPGWPTFQPQTWPEVHLVPA